MNEAHTHEYDELDGEALEAGEPAWAGEPLAVPADAQPDASLDAAQLVSPLPDDVVLPPDRVRFSAPVVVEIPGEDEPCDGVIVNLSDSGLACVLPLELDDGERIRCRFRPSLGEEHLEVDAEVVWRRDAGEADVLYGLRLLDVSEDVAERLHDVVRERSEGRAGAWPLPLAPSSSGRAPSPYMMAVAGMALGAVLSFGIAFLPDVVFGSRESTEVGPALNAQGAELADTGTTAAAESDEPAAAHDDAKPTESAPAEAENVARFAAPAAPKATEAPAATAKPTVVAEVQPAVARPEPKPEARTAAPARPAAAPARAVADTKPGRPHALESHQSGKSGELTLYADHAPTALKTFWMDSPRRLVVDAIGARTGLEKSEYKMGGPLATRVRVGTHPDRVRFVIETAPGVTAEVKAKGTALSVQLRK